MNKSNIIKTSFNRKVLRSSDTNVFKFVFTKPDVAVEAVLYRYGSFRKRTVICCSTQCGCPVGCSFCGTGRGFVRSLYSDEIVDQIQQVMEIVEKDCPSSEIEKFQIMFMSMGEPFLNYRNLHDAIVRLHETYPTAQLLVSTSAPSVLASAKYPFSEFCDMSRSIPKIGIQFSVHESTDEARYRLIPTPTCSLEQIARLGETWAARTSRKPFYNYCVHAWNSSDADVARLVSLFNPAVWETTLSVICEKNETVKASHERQLPLIWDFSRRLLKRGASVRIFDPAGQDDIGGGCGQLWFFQKWLREHRSK
ncbi:MAG: rRNA methyltransferase [Kiritimatiellae bacterium]|nr:rRNA methyltransferase [Kiritimatiellia bacterium]